MINLTNIARILLCGRGVNLLINKNFTSNFVLRVSMLTVWLITFTIDCVHKSKSYVIQFILYGSVLLAIKTKSLLLFYMFFEFSIVPVSLIVFLFGYQPEKLHASLFLIMYTVAGRLPLLIYIISTPTAVFVGTFMTIPVTLGFLIKSPIYLLHV